MIESLEARQMLAVFGPGLPYLPVSGDALTWTCQSGICFSAQGVMGSGTGTYRFYADDQTSVDILYEKGTQAAPEFHSINFSYGDPKHGGGSSVTRLVTLEIPENREFDGYIYNPTAPAIKVRSQWDESTTDRMLGPFLYDVYLENTFTLQFSPPLEGDMQVQYRWGKEPWKNGTEFTRNIDTFDVGSTDIDVRVRDAQGRLLYEYVSAAYVSTNDDWATSVTWDDGRGTVIPTEGVRFIENVSAGSWTAEVRSNYLPVAEAYKNHEFALGFTYADSPNVVRFSTPLTPSSSSASKVIAQANNILVGSLFDDRVPGVDGIDYFARIIAKPPLTNATYSRPFSSREPIETTALPAWMNVGPDDVEYEQTDAFGKPVHAYVIDAGTLEFENELPTTSDTPYGLFDGRKTYLSSELDIKIYAPATHQISPKVKAEEWEIEAVLLDEKLTNFGGTLLKDSSIHVAGQLEPHALGIDGAGILITADPLVFASNKVLAKSKIQGIDFTIPLVTAGIGTLDGRLKIDGNYEVIAREVSLSAGVQLITSNGGLLLKREGTFARLALSGSGRLELDGTGSLGISPGFTPPPNLSEAQKQKLEQFRLELLQVVAKGIGEINLDGLVQVNFQGPLNDPTGDFKDTEVSISGKIELKYNTCFGGDDLREFFNLAACNSASELKTLGSYHFGPKVILGEAPKEPDPNDSTSYDAKGNGVSGGSDSTGGGAGEGAASAPDGATVGSLRFRKPFDAQLKQVEYEFVTQSNVGPLPPETYFFQLYAIAADDEVLLDLRDLAAEVFDPDTGLSTVRAAQVLVEPGQLRDDRSYRLEFRLTASPNASPDAVLVRLLDFQTSLQSPSSRVTLAGATLTEDVIDFGPSTAQGISAAISIHNDSSQPLEIESVEIVGDGFLLVDSPPWHKLVLAGNSLTYVAQLVDTALPAQALLRIRTNDPRQPVRDILLNYEGILALSRSGPRVTQFEVTTAGSSDAALSLLTTSATTTQRTNLDQIVVAFDRSVRVPEEALNVHAPHQPTLAVADFAYDDATHTARWTLSEPLAPGAFGLSLIDIVVDVYGNRLDGELLGGTITGDGTAGGQSQCELRLESGGGPTAPLVAPPALQSIPSQSVDESIGLSVVARGTTAVADDRVEYRLVAGPAYATIDSDTGEIEWLPPERYPAGRYHFVIEARHANTPSKAAYQSFEVDLHKSNSAPLFAAIAPIAIRQRDTLDVRVTATDGDFPVQSLTYFLLEGAPVDATIDPLSGRLHWPTALDLAPGRYLVPIGVADDGEPRQISTFVLAVDVLPRNSAPLFGVLPAPNAIEHQEISWAISAIDVDSPPPTFRLVRAPSGMVIDSNSGEIRWTPSEQDGGLTHSVVVELVDSRDPTVVTRGGFSVFVLEQNTPPDLTFPDAESLTTSLGVAVDFTVELTDQDIPERYKEYYLEESDDDRATLNIFTGRFSWTPTEPGDFSFTVRVVDYNFGDNATAIESFTITVLPDETPPEIQLSTMPTTMSPTIVVEVHDKSAVEQVRVRLIDPPTDFLTIEYIPYISLIDSQQLQGLLGQEFAEEEYTAEVEATDAFGNVSTAQISFRIDLTPPLPALLTLAPESDAAPVGDGISQLERVRVKAQLEPWGLVRLFPYSATFDSTVYEGLADENGLAIVENVPLEILGSNLFAVETHDAAGNVTSSDFALTRHSNGGVFGPNAVGYVATSVAPGFVDISTTGQSLLARTTESFLELTTADLPGFQFSFYGQNYDSLNINDDGILTFLSSEFSSPGSWLSANPAIAPFWTNAYLAEPTEDVYWQWTPSGDHGTLTVQWNVSAQGQTSDGEYIDTLIRFQAVLDTNDQSIAFHYDQLFPVEHPRLQFGEEVFIGPGGGVPATDNMALVLASYSAPHDLVGNQVSVRIAPSEEPRSPYLRANWLASFPPDDAAIPAFPLHGNASDTSGLAALNLELVGVPGSLFSLLPLESPGHEFEVELSTLETAWGHPLADGSWVFRLTATDVFGLSTTLDFPFDVDRTPPELAEFLLTSATDGLILGDWVTDVAQVGFEGRTEPGATVYVHGPLYLASGVASDAAGRFVVESLGLEVGENQIEITIVDEAGNERTETRVVTRLPELGTARDAAGYRASVISHGFQDISTTGAKLQFPANESWVELSDNNLGEFYFSLYGEVYSTLLVGRDGFLSLGPPLAVPVPPFHMGFNPASPSIIPLGDALIPSASSASGVYWLVEESSDGARLIVQWQEFVFANGNTSPVTFQAVLNSADGSIEFHYENLATGDQYDEGWQSTIGIKAAGEHDESNKLIDLSSFGYENLWVGTGKSVRISRELAADGAPRVRTDLPTVVGMPQQLDSLTIHFDRAMAQSSFSIAADVRSFMGPSGDLLSAITGYRWLDLQTLQITFTPQTVEGEYVLELNPSIVSRFNAITIDQDQDGLPGEPDEDVTTIRLPLQRCVTSASSGYEACLTTLAPIKLKLGEPGVFVIHFIGDDASAPVDLGPHTLRVDQFTVAGADSLHVSVNGIVSIDVPTMEFQPSDMRNLSAPLSIAPLWSDWQAHPSDDDLVLGWIEENRGPGLPNRLVIQWQVYNFTYSPGFDASTATFQAMFELDTVGASRIVYQYPHLELLASAADTPFPATVGLHGDRFEDDPFLLTHPLAPAAWPREGQAWEIVLHSPRAWIDLETADATTAIAEIPLVFSQSITGFGLDDLRWSRNGESLSLSEAQLSGDGTHWTLALPAASQIPGDYQLTLVNDGSIGSSSGTLIGEESVRWTLHDLNYAPTEILLTAVQVPAYQLGALVGILTAVDEDAGQNYVWEVSDPRFIVIDGQLRLAPEESLDYEDEHVAPLEITVTDSGFPPRSFSQQINVEILDAPHAPRSLQLAGALIKEKLAGQAVGRLFSGTDQPGELLVYGVADSRFEVVGGVLRLVDDAYLNWDDGNSVQLDVRISRLDAPAIVSDFVVALQVARNRYPWHHEVRPLDANRDGAVTPVDALWVINELNQPILAVNSLLPSWRPASSELAYFDVNPDGLVTPLDALLVINWLNGVSEGEAEGELAAIIGNLVPSRPPVPASREAAAEFDTDEDWHGARHSLIPAKNSKAPPGWEGANVLPISTRDSTPQIATPGRGRTDHSEIRDRIFQGCLDEILSDLHD